MAGVLHVFVLLAGLLDGARVEHVDMDAINALFSEVAKTGRHSTAAEPQQQQQSGSNSSSRGCGKQCA